MNHVKSIVAVGALALMAQAAPAANQLAFPGAQGWGRYAKGGRGGSVYHVTNLNDSGTGSLRDAVSKSNRIIVFDVAGVINLSSRLVFSSNLYVAGQTAPGEGVTVYGNGVSFSGASNIICRHMRFRMGKNGDSGKDCAGIANGTNMIFDHCSFAWGLDETFSINPDGKGDLYNITLMNCVVGQGLLTHSAGGLMQADSITLYRNFYCDNSTRNNKVKGYHQYVNNVVYNWSSGCYLMGGDSSGESHANTQGNLFVNGPSGSGDACTSGNSGFHIYADDNWQDRNKDGVFNPYLIPESEYGGGPDFQKSPYNFPELEIVSAKDLVAQSLPTVGASLPYRDYVDYYMVEEFMSYGTKGALISTETTLPYGVPSSWTVYQGEKRVDTDGDGMPDAWETANGTDPNKDDAMTIAANGYANIENYINSISQETVDFYLRQPMLISKKEATSSALTISWSDYTEGEEGFIVELEEGSEYKEVGRTTGTHMTIGTLEPATAYTVRVCAYKGDEKSAYTKATYKTQPLAVDLVEISKFAADYIWRGGNGVWDFATDSWNEGAFADGGNVLFDLDADATVTLSETVTPGDVVVNGSGNLTLTGAGAIAGTKSVNKAGSGVLKVETANTYTGATVLHGGVFEFSKLGNGSVASGLGASQEFSQNWIWDGGTYRYTGGSVSTNRSAQLYSDSEWEITDASATVKTSGVFEGQGGLTLSGAGTLQPSAVDFFGYEGNTTLAGGTLYLNGVSTMWTNYNKTVSSLGSSEKLIFAGGSLETKDVKEVYSTYSIPMEVQEGTYSYFKPNAWCYIKSKVSGNGTLEFVVPYLREEIQGNWDDFTGTLVANGVPTTGSESMLYIDNGVGFKNGRLYLKGNIFALSWPTNSTTYIGGLSGEKGTYLSGSTKNTKNSVTNWIIGGADTDETFNGVIDNRCGASGYTCTVNIQKIGSGDWRLTGTNIYNGTTVINGGRIIVNGKNNGTGAVTVNDEGTLAGFGTVAAPVTVKAGGTVYAGDTLVNSGKGLTLSNTLKVENGGIVSVPLFRTGVLNKSNKFIFKKAVTLAEGAILQLDVTEMTKTPTSGSKFTIFDLSATGASITGEFASIDPATPGEGLVWDTASLYTDGILYVRKDESETAIETVNGDAARVLTTTYFDLSGKQVYYPATPGVYVVKTRTADGKISVRRQAF